MKIFFLCGLIIPTLSGVYAGNDRGLMLRDLLAFSFLGLPLFLVRRFEGREQARTILCWLLASVGILFCLRTLIPAFNIWVPQGELLYLSNSPLALFAGIYLAWLMWEALREWRSVSPIKLALPLAGLAIVLAAMVLDVQRATIGAIFLSLLLFAVNDLVKRPRKAVVPLLAFALIAAFLFPLLSGMGEAIVKKTSEVGFNMRVQEARAVFDSLSGNALSLFTGRGWGSVFSSPAVGGLDVNYTHSLLTTMMLKGGLVLFLPALCVAIAGVYQIFLIFQSDRGKGLSLFWPFIIPVLLYASHKSLDFGLLLLLIGVWSIPALPLQESNTSCRQKGTSSS